MNNDSLIPIPTYTRDVSILASVLWTLLFVIGAMMNGLMIVVILKNRKLQTAPNWLVFSMSVTDFVSLVFIRPIGSMAVYMHGWHFGLQSCRVIAFFNSFIFSLMLANLCFMAINRYVLIAHTAIYPKIFSKIGTLFVVTPFILFLTINLLLPFMGVWGEYGYVAEVNSCGLVVDTPSRSLFSMYAMAVGFGIPLVIMLYCYIRIFLLVRAQKKKISSHNSKVARGEQKLNNADVKLAKVMASIFCLYIVCILPRLSLSWIDKHNRWPMAQTLAGTALIAYSVLNNIVFIAQNQQIRLACFKLLHIKINQVTMEQSSASGGVSQTKTMTVVGHM
ncbi:unnamed protein product [Owenia fusiformis]|uniref:Uncharacterized protein n=1 Tax=Owenia fusiformis TaxID=6347 RepID=A0A8J1XJV8_OWEFU|nr:unnamed protein product [Owenia fusiformis]